MIIQTVFGYILVCICDLQVETIQATSDCLKVNAQDSTFQVCFVVSFAGTCL